MQNKYRLRANQYDRETEDEKIRPYRIYYIAVEGNATEKEYFEGLSPIVRILEYMALYLLKYCNVRPKMDTVRPSRFWSYWKNT